MELNTQIELMIKSYFEESKIGKSLVRLVKEKGKKLPIRGIKQWGYQHRS
jgi:hypothetical protein